MKGKKGVVPNGRCVVLYNLDKKEVIGIFRKPHLASRYLYKDYRVGMSRISSGCMYKQRMRNTLFNFPVISRYATIEQLELLGEDDCVILNGYKIPGEYSMKGYKKTVCSLQHEHDETWRGIWQD